jgi:hypothetical protein
VHRARGRAGRGRWRRRVRRRRGRRRGACRGRGWGRSVCRRRRLRGSFRARGCDARGRGGRRCNARRRRGRRRRGCNARRGGAWRGLCARVRRPVLRRSGRLPLTRARGDHVPAASQHSREEPPAGHQRRELGRLGRWHSDGRLGRRHSDGRLGRRHSDGRLGCVSARLGLGRNACLRSPDPLRLGVQLSVAFRHGRGLGPRLRGLGLRPGLRVGRRRGGGRRRDLHPGGGSSLGRVPGLCIGRALGGGGLAGCIRGALVWCGGLEGGGLGSGRGYARRRRRGSIGGRVVAALEREGHSRAPARGFDADAASCAIGLPVHALLGGEAGDSDRPEPAQMPRQGRLIAQLRPQLRRGLDQRPLDLRRDHRPRTSRGRARLLQRRV